MPIKTLCVAVMLAPASCLQINAGHCDHTKPISATVAIGSATTARIRSDAGELKVRGESGLTEARIEGEACGDSEDILDELRLVARVDGSELIIHPETPAGRGDRRMRLDIRLPDSMAVIIRDGSGALEVSHVASLDLMDGSGPIRIQDIANDVVIKDGAGSIDIERVGGSVRLRDGSGGIQVRDVGGDLVIENAGSGRVNYANIAGQVSGDLKR